MKEKNSVRKLAVMAMLVAVSVVLTFFIHFPLFPAASFLEYDPADIPIFIGTFLFGPVSGLLLTVVTSVVQGLTVSASSGPIGILMHIFATGSFALIAGNLYRRLHTRKGAVLSLIVGTLSITAMMVLWNLVFTPIFMGQPIEAVKAMLVPVIIPFNLLKAGVNSLITFLVYKRVSIFVERMGLITLDSADKIRYNN